MTVRCQKRAHKWVTPAVSQGAADGERGGQEKRRNGSAGARAWPGSAGCQLAAGASAETLL